MADQALRIIAVDSPFAARNMRSRLEKLKRDKLDMLNGATDWADFKKRCGFIEGVDHAIAICEELDSNERGS